MTTDTNAAVDRRALATLSHADQGWLDARHHFLFADCHDPAPMGWGAIRVPNDDAIASGNGFPPERIGTGGGAALCGGGTFTITAVGDAEIVLVDAA